MGVTIQPVSKAFVAGIAGVDLSQPVDDETFEKIRNALYKYKVLAFPNQNLTPERQIAFSSRFGKLQPHSLKRSNLPGHEEIFVIATHDEAGIPKAGYKSGRFWHAEYSYLNPPAAISLLRAVELPGEGLGDTVFADLAAAYDALPDKMKKRIDGLKVAHRYFAYTAYESQNTQSAVDMDRTEADKITLEELEADGITEVPEAVHPVVTTHPVTGQKALYVHAGLSTAIEGMPEDESASLLKELFEHSTRPQFLYCHKWNTGDLAAWDNRLVMHRATPFESSRPREMHRTTVAGEPLH